MLQSSRNALLVGFLAEPCRRIDCSHYCLRRHPDLVPPKNSTSSVACCFDRHRCALGMGSVHTNHGEDLVPSCAQTAAPASDATA